MKKQRIVFLLIGLLIADLNYADNAALIQNQFPLSNEPKRAPNLFSQSLWNTGPWSSRFTGQGLFSKNQLAGFMDGMIPIMGQNDQLVYFDGSMMGGRYDSLVSSLGGGLRQIKHIYNTDFILGGFAFADYQQFDKGEVWIGNPGFELLTKHQEVRIQGYIPMSHRTQSYNSLMASEIPQFVLNDSGKINNLSSIQGHGFSDTPVSLTKEYGTGIEGEVGQYLPIGRGAWLRGGGYHFSYQNAKSINGVEANIELFTVKNWSLIIQDNYDNQNKNKFSLGVRLNFGGPDATQVASIANRMEVPVIRHMARQPSGLSSPIRDSFIVAGPTQTTNNIWFFSPTGVNPTPFSIASCTAENPCLTLDQTTATGIDLLAPAASLWFATGNYSLPTTGSNGYVSLFAGQSLYGRSSNFQTVSVGADRATIEGGLLWAGNGLFNNLQINNVDQITAIPGVSVITGLYASGDLQVNNSNVTASASSSIATPNTRVRAVQSDSANLNGVTVTNSTINSTGRGNVATIGLFVPNTNAFISNSILNSTAFGSGFLSGFNGQVVNINNSRVIADAGAGTGTVNGINANIKAIVNNTVINASGGGLINGIFVNGTGNLDTNSVVANNINITATSSGSSQALAIVTDNKNIDVADSTLNVTGISRPVGIAANSGDVNIRNTTLNITAIGMGDFTNGIFASGDISLSKQSAININSSALSTIGLVSINGNIRVDSSTIDTNGNMNVYGLQATMGNATLTNGATVRATNISTNGITRGIEAVKTTFTGASSSVYATAFNSSNSPEAITGLVNNDSISKSQCYENGVQQDCS